MLSPGVRRSGFGWWSLGIGELSVDAAESIALIDVSYTVIKHLRPRNIILVLLVLQPLLLQLLLLLLLQFLLFMRLGVHDDLMIIHLGLQLDLELRNGSTQVAIIDSVHVFFAGGRGIIIRGHIQV